MSKLKNWQRTEKKSYNTNTNLQIMILTMMIVLTRPLKLDRHCPLS